MCPLTLYEPPDLPLAQPVETVPVLKKAITATKALAILNGVITQLPNPVCLMQSLLLQESKDSASIENIITTHDALYQATLGLPKVSPETQSVYQYSLALQAGMRLMQKDGLILMRHTVAIQGMLVGNTAGIRAQAGTVLKHQQTGETIYTPPQSVDDIRRLLATLERYINTPDNTNPIVKMAIIHHQFESIHPFYDGNGRTGRILNSLYLMYAGELVLPVLYLSRYIEHHKTLYYKRLQSVRTTGKWEPWIMYMLNAVEKTAQQETTVILEMIALMETTTQQLKTAYPKLYSTDLVVALFSSPYTKIDTLAHTLGITRQTASTYLKKLVSIGIMAEKKVHSRKVYINSALFRLLTQQF